MGIRAAITTLILMVIVAVWWGISVANLHAQKGLILERLTYDLAVFYGDYKRLPNSWDEFTEWSRAKRTTTSWSTEVLKGRFALEWGAQISQTDSQSPKLFVVLDSKFKDIGPYVNQRLYEQCLLAIRTHAPQQK